MYKIFYTPTTNLDEHHEPIDNNLILSQESDTDTLEDGYSIVSKWDLDNWHTIEANNKSSKLQQLNQSYEDRVATLTVGIPTSETLTWAKQEQEARAYLLDNTVATPFIDTLVASRGVDKTYLVNKIVEKANLYTLAIATLTGNRQKQEDMI